MTKRLCVVVALLGRVITPAGSSGSVASPEALLIEREAAIKGARIVGSWRVTGALSGTRGRRRAAADIPICQSSDQQTHNFIPPRSSHHFFAVTALASDFSSIKNRSSAISAFTVLHDRQAITRSVALQH